MAREARVESVPEHARVSSREIAEIAAIAGFDRKAEDVRVLDVQGLSSYADYLVLMTATSDRQVSAVADAIDAALKKSGVRTLGVEGVGAGNWILIDTGDVVVHVFHHEARGFYDLDSLWSDAKRVTVKMPAPPAIPAAV